MGLSIWHLLVVLAIVLVLFGAKRLRNLGGDLGAAIKGFKDAVTDGKNGEQATAEAQQATQAQAPAQAQAQIAPQPTLSPYAQTATQQPQPTVIVQPAPTVAPQSQTHHHG